MLLLLEYNFLNRHASSINRQFVLKSCMHGICSPSRLDVFRRASKQGQPDRDLSDLKLNIIGKRTGTDTMPGSVGAGCIAKSYCSSLEVGFVLQTGDGVGTWRAQVL